VEPVKIREESPTFTLETFLGKLPAVKKILWD
jgi:hypothetical protein